MRTARAIVCMLWGPQALQKAVLAPGESLVLGPESSPVFPIRYDKQLQEHPVELHWDGTVCRVRAVGGGESVLLSGRAGAEGALGHGDWFRAGGSTFLLCCERATPPRVLPEPGRAQPCARALEALRAAEGTLYTLLDAARDERILELLRESPDEARSLYDGVKGDAMADVAPYLARLDPRSWLREALIEEGWGRSWGIYLDCPLSFQEVRRHFRRLLRVEEAASAEPLYFRFYDPRVLRACVRTWTPEQLDPLYGPVTCFIVEDNGASPLLLPRRTAPAARSGALRHDGRS